MHEAPRKLGRNGDTWVRAGRRIVNSAGTRETGDKRGTRTARVLDYVRAPSSRRANRVRHGGADQSASSRMTHPVEPHVNSLVPLSQQSPANEQKGERRFCHVSLSLNSSRFAVNA